VQRVLVLGSSFSAIDMIQRVKSLGFHVIVCGVDPGEPGHSISHESIFLDYKDIEELKKFLRANQVEFVVPTSNDVAYRTGLELSKEFDFPGYDKYEEGLLFLEKDSYRKICKDLNLRIPIFQTTEARDLLSIQSKFEIPFLIKPAQGFSGIGIIKVQKESERLEVESIEWDHCSDDIFVVEKFLEGTLHSHSAFTQDGRIIQDFFVDEFCTINQFAVDSSNYPSRVSQEVREQVRGMIGTLLGPLNLVDGLIHTQFMISQGEAVLIESMRRCPGDLFPNLIGLSTGFDYIYNYIAPFLNMPLVIPTHFSKEALPIARFTVADSQENQIFGISVPSESENFIFYPLLKNGDSFMQFPKGKVGILFVELSNIDTLFSEVPNFQSKIGIIN